MANFRPAGLSDEDTDSEDGFYEKPARNYHQTVSQHSTRKKIEINLQDAILNGNIKEVEKIIIHDLNNTVNLKLDSGWTPLMHACFHAQENIVQFLLEHGADPNLHSDSVTPTMVACSNNSANKDTIYHIITSLIEKGCILNVGDKYGQTPLMRAIASGSVAVVQKLLDSEVNIEMRDQQGWTAVFWAAHHNQPEILEMLISAGARLTEVDKSGRKPIDIATSHDFNNIVEILESYTKPADKADGETDPNEHSLDQLASWQDYYPGLKDKSEKITYANEIPHLLYGMNCERLTPLILKSGMDLRSFLLMDDQDMCLVGVEMPYERQRLRHGLMKFHTRGWKLNSVSGLYARKSDTYSLLDCVATLGNHLHQVYILEASLQYVQREYKKVERHLKFEPPDAPLRTKLKAAVKNLLKNIDSIRKETSHMKKLLVKINENNPAPADYIKEKSVRDIAAQYFSEFMVACSIGFLFYSSKHLYASLGKK